MKILQKIIYILILFNGFIFAQHVDSLVAEALKNNPQLKALKYEVAEAEYKGSAAGYLPPPSLGVEFSQIPIDEYNIFTKSLSQNLSLSQMFMLGGKLSAMSAAETKAAEAALARYNALRQDIAARVRTQYYNIWMIEHHIILREDNLELLNGLYETSSSLFKVNRAKYSDLLFIKSEIASEKSNIINLEAQLSGEIYKMNSLLGRELSSVSLEVNHSWDIDTVSFNEENLRRTLLTLNPEISEMDKMIEMNRLEITAVNKQLIPDLMLEGMIMRMPNGMPVTTQTQMTMPAGGTEYMYSIMASITLPFAPWASGRIKDEESRLLSRINSVESQKLNMQREMLASLNAELKNIKALRRQISLFTSEILPAYKQTFEAMLTEYQNNQQPVSTVFETIRMILMKEEELAELQMQHQMVLSDIYKMIGIYGTEDPALLKEITK